MIDQIITAITPIVGVAMIVMSAVMCIGTLLNRQPLIGMYWFGSTMILLSVHLIARG